MGFIVLFLFCVLFSMRLWLFAVLLSIIIFFFHSFLLLLLCFVGFCNVSVYLNFIPVSGFSWHTTLTEDLQPFLRSKRKRSRTFDDDDDDDDKDEDDNDDDDGNLKRCHRHKGSLETCVCMSVCV